MPLGSKLISSKIADWVFIPFNFQNSQRSVLLNTELNDRGIWIDSVRKFDRLWSNYQTRNLIKNAYGNIPGNFNTNSMTLYSGPENNDRFQLWPLSFKKNFSWNHYQYIDYVASGCLYFGDYEAKGTRKWNDLYNRYRNYWNKIGTVQIPHHGSRHNYNREINKIKPMLSVISAGNSNRHRHPHSSTIRNIVVDGGWPIIVDEGIGSRLQYKIHNI